VSTERLMLASEGLLTDKIRRAILSATCYASASPNNNNNNNNNKNNNNNNL